MKQTPLTPHSVQALGWELRVGMAFNFHFCTKERKDALYHISY